MRTPIYLIAKYIPDLQRIEPRNIGIIVWSSAGVEARFLAEKQDRPGEIDGRSIPSFVTSASTYRQWIQFWRAELNKPQIESAIEAGKVRASSPDFLSALQSWNRGNFFLAEGGHLLDEVESDDLPELADHLFASLVDSTAVEDIRDPTLEELCDRLIHETKLSNDSHFISRYTLSCPVGPSVVEEFEFSHAYKNGSLQRLYHRVPLPKRKSLLRKTVHDCAWMFEKVIHTQIISREQSGVLIYATEEQQEIPSVSDALYLLDSVSRVLNLNDYETVKAEFEHLSMLVSS